MSASEPAPGLPRERLERYLARAVTYDNGIHSDTLDDDLRLIARLRAKFLGRAAHIWHIDDTYNDDAHFAAAAHLAQRAHALDHDLILQACIFEAVYNAIDRIPIPDWVFREFNLTPEHRTFRFHDMAPPEFREVYHWWYGGTVPDMRSLDTRLWFFYRAARYIDAGYEALHLGQVHLVAGKDPGYALWADVCERIRNYAATHARRRFILLDAHTHGIAIHGRLVFDFHSRPLSFATLAIPDHLALIRRGDSLGGITPNGWSCTALPFLWEVDNWGGTTLTPEQMKDNALRARTHRWGYDDIAWLAHLPPPARNHFLEYATRFTALQDQAAFFQPPMRRTLGKAPVTLPNGRTTVWYKANNSSDACPDGFNQEDTIHALWSDSSRKQHDQLRRFCPESLQLAAPKPQRDPATGLDDPDLVVLVGSAQEALTGRGGNPFSVYTRLLYRGNGLYELPALFPYPGTYDFAVALEGTHTEVYRRDGLSHGPNPTLHIDRPNTFILFRFNYRTRTLTAHPEPTM